MPMRTIVLPAVLAILAIQACTFARAEDRVLTVVKHAWNHPQESSVLLKFNGSKAVNVASRPHGEKTRSWIQVWNNLYPQAYSEGHADVKEGEWGYFLEFSEDAEGTKRVAPLHVPKHGKAPNDIAAQDFIDGDKTWPAILGTMYVNAPGEVRYLDYPGFTVQIRTLEYELARAGESRPAFKTYSCLVTIREKAK